MLNVQKPTEEVLQEIIEAGNGSPVKLIERMKQVGYEIRPYGGQSLNKVGIPLEYLRNGDWSQLERFLRQVDKKLKTKQLQYAYDAYNFYLLGAAL